MILLLDEPEVRKREKHGDAERPDESGRGIIAARRDPPLSSSNLERKAGPGRRMRLSGRSRFYREAHAGVSPAPSPAPKADEGIDVRSDICPD